MTFTGIFFSSEQYYIALLRFNWALIVSQAHFIRLQQPQVGCTKYCNSIIPLTVDTILNYPVAISHVDSQSVSRLVAVSIFLMGCISPMNRCALYCVDVKTIILVLLQIRHDCRCCCCCCCLFFSLVVCYGNLVRADYYSETQCDVCCVLCNNSDLPSGEKTVSAAKKNSTGQSNKI